jgi:hypothetical protein
LYRIGIGDYRLVDAGESSGLIVIVVERREAEPPPGRTRRGDAGAVRPRGGPGTSPGGGFAPQALIFFRGLRWRSTPP